VGRYSGPELGRCLEPQTPECGGACPLLLEGGAQGGGDGEPGFQLCALESVQRSIREPRKVSPGALV
jgi:hypothetical protein